MVDEILFFAFILLVAMILLFSYFGSVRALITFIREPKHIKELWLGLSLKELKSASTLVLYLITVLSMFATMTILVMVDHLPLSSGLTNVFVSFLGAFIILQIGLLGLIMFVRKEYPTMFATIDGRIVQFVGFLLIISSLGLMFWFGKIILLRYNM